jgi:glycosyltransferase involved in cell wall biosynthesis
MRSDILIAPYPVASASGTIVMAVCVGMGVIAYDVGAINDVVTPEELVRPGDELGFARKIEYAIEHRCRGGGRRIEAWRNESERAWVEIVTLE